ncbi:hypothetical protein Ddye_010421 [Dipteronia dyeriana]|uniref:Ubiquitin-like protease family profile domain-containing protein n=1 Tax=Dipteronia dyeriana TaxID=168575 RepID=A0AAE0CNB1_9ROSI|nr:hypothetical protein Ddye_010421 [Dipteronia dyeriana]
MVVLLKECEERMTAFCGAKFKESEERITAFCKAEFVSIREEMAALHKVGDTTVVVTSEQHIHTSSNIGSGEKSQSEEYGDTGVDAKLDESDLPTKIFDAKLDNTFVLVEGSVEASAQDPDAEMEASVISDAVAKDPNNDVEPTKSDIPTTNLNVGEEQPHVYVVLAEHVLFTPTEMDEINHSILLATQQHVPLSKVQVQVQVQGIVVDDYPSPAVNMLVPNSDQSVIALDKADPNVEYKDQDKIRVRKWSRFLGSPWTDPMPKKRKKKSSKSEELSTQTESNYNEFTSFLASKDPTKVYVGQIQQYMFRQDFKQIVDKNEWISNLVLLKKVWPTEIERIQIQRDVKEIEAVHGKPKGRKKISPTQVLEVWDEYPEFVPLEFEPEEHFCTYVRGDDSLYEPWWTMELVLIPCNTNGHWVLCQVFLKEGKVNLFDSMWGRSDKKVRLREINCLLYLFPSILHRVGYYEQLGIKPRNNAFLVENIEKSFLPQQAGEYWFLISVTHKMSSFIIYIYFCPLHFAVQLRCVHA